jgi:hypothetical protein
MRVTAELKRPEPVSQTPSFAQGPVPLAEPAEDPSQPARGIVIACGISLAFWLTVLSLLV